MKRFQKYLQGEGYVTTIRSTRGDDIMAACGQLVGQVNDKPRRKERAQNNSIIILDNINSLNYCSTNPTSCI